MKICPEYAALLDPFADGELTAEEMCRVQAHLETCPACRAYVDDILAIRAAFPDVEDTAVPEGFAGRVSAAIREEAAPAKKRKMPWKKTLLPMAACCAIVILLAKTPLAARNSSSAGRPADGALEYAMVAEDDAAPEAAPYDNGAAVTNRSAEEDGAYGPADVPEAASESEAEGGEGTRDAQEIGNSGGLAPSPAAKEDGGTPSAPEMQALSPEEEKDRTPRETAPQSSMDTSQPRITAAAIQTAWIPASQADLLAEYAMETDEDGAALWRLTAEEYGALLDALAQRGETVLEGSPAREEIIGESVVVRVA